MTARGSATESIHELHPPGYACRALKVGVQVGAAAGPASVVPRESSISYSTEHRSFSTGAHLQVKKRRFNGLAKARSRHSAPMLLWKQNGLQMQMQVAYLLDVLSVPGFRVRSSARGQGRRI